MRNLIENIFEEYSYIRAKNIGDNAKNLEFWVPTKNTLEAFFIVLYVSDLEELSEEIISDICIDYYDNMKKTNVLYASSDKNTYVIVCTNLKTTNYPLSFNQQLQRKIYDIEENPYVFKKHVILYNDEQVTNLKKLSISSGRKVVEIILNIANDIEKFTEYKLNPNIDNIYWLVSSLFIKLPFLKYKAESKVLKDLSELVSGRIIELGNDKKTLIKDVLNFDMENIKKLSEDQIFEILKGGQQ